MACGSCSSGGCGSLPGGCRNNGACGTGGCNKLNVFDWLAGMEFPAGSTGFNIVEVRFKNTRKDFFKVNEGEEYHSGDIVAVEAATGHDIGIVSLSGELVKVQMKKRGIRIDNKDIKKVYRKARQADIDKWRDAQSLEQDTMIRARKIAIELGLEMKISDVEYQGDKTKATFFYTADDRVDFRELIKVLADKFKVRIEMRQIGARQEAGRLGGIGSCGRELCCSTWLTDFRTVSTSAARYQQLSINPIKLAGQCGKLKCCLNFELDSYLDALKDFPQGDTSIQSEKGLATLQKTDIFRRMLWYSYVNEPNVFIPMKLERVKEIMAMNKKGKKPFDLKDHESAAIVEKKPDYENVVGQDSLTRFDAKKNGQNSNPNRKKNKNRNKHKRPQQNNAQPNKS